MSRKVALVWQLIRNMGWRYILFRIRFEIERRSGLLKRKFPTNPPFVRYVSLAAWKNAAPKFFFNSREELSIPRNPTDALRQKHLKAQQGIFTFFSATDYLLGTGYDWFTNPSNNYRYPLQHWTEISDYSEVSGDIKFVWEKSRFSYLYPTIRYDYHFQEDQAVWVFSEINSWIAANPINQGPNWRCSQEISLRVLNWLFALHYYKNSPILTEDTFQVISHSIYWQLRHVYSNINFSRIAVRNNHAITETLTLYLAGLLLPHFPEAALWKKEGKRWFEQEVAYQIYGDGTFLQFSMNYHRVVVQLLSWAFYLAERNGERFSDVVYERGKKSLHFLQVCQDEVSGQLPNYGANDGALFFPLSDTDYRDYRPQLNALHYYFYRSSYQAALEDLHWYGVNDSTIKQISLAGIFSFPTGGYYVFREAESITFVRCGNHLDRPSQADNLHLDIWVKGENVLRDAGSYKYNTSSEELRYFMGTASHNTIQLNNQDQMLKGSRFIWYYWTQATQANITKTSAEIIFEGEISAFGQISKGIRHRRRVTKLIGKYIWIVEDTIVAPQPVTLQQWWHPNSNKLRIIASKESTSSQVNAYYSGYYGVKEKTIAWLVETNEPTLRTIIELNEIL